MTAATERRPRELDLTPAVTPDTVILVDDPAWVYARKLPKVLWSLLSDVDREDITFVSGDDEPSAQTGKIVVYAYQDKLRAKFSDGTVVNLVTNDDTVALINATVFAERDRALLAEAAMSTVPYDYGLIPAYPNPRSLADRKLDRAVPLTEFAGVVAGTGTDSAAGLQRAIDWAATNRRLLLVNAPFRTSVALALPRTDGYGLVGEGGNLTGTPGPCIAQSTDNTPCLFSDTAAFAGGSGFARDLRLEGFGIGHMAAQAATATNAAGLQIWNMVYQSKWDGLCFFNSVAGIGSKAYAPDQVNASILWGMHIGKLQFYNHVLGCILLNTAGVGASPNNIIGHIYAINVGSAGNFLFDFNEWAAFEIGGIEVNTVAADALWLKVSTSGSWGRCKWFRIENNPGTPTTETTGTKMLLNASRFSIDFLAVEGIKVNDADASLQLISGFTPGARLKIGPVKVIINGTAGAYGLFIVYQWPVDGRVEIESVDYDPTKCSLTKYGFDAASSEVVSVNSFASGLVSRDIGDVDHVMPLTGPGIVRCSTTLTANRVWTLPSLSGIMAESFHLAPNIRRKIVRNAATPGNFTLTVKDGAGTTIATLPANAKSVVDIGWSRGAFMAVSPVGTLP
jgi:hypothetical protein